MAFGVLKLLQPAVSAPTYREHQNCLSFTCPFAHMISGPAINPQNVFDSPPLGIYFSKGAMDALALSSLMRTAGPVLERRPSSSCYIPRTKYICSISVTRCTCLPEVALSWTSHGHADAVGSAQMMVVVAMNRKTYLHKCAPPSVGYQRNYQLIRVESMVLIINY